MEENQRNCQREMKQIGEGSRCCVEEREQAWNFDFSGESGWRQLGRTAVRSAESARFGQIAAPIGWILAVMAEFHSA
jgi:hypothetical protein